MKTHKVYSNNGYNPDVHTVGVKDLAAGEIWVYYVDGFRRYIGTVKFHLYLDCKYLVHHKPGRGEGDFILKTNHSEGDIDGNSMMCKVCVKRHAADK